MLSRPRSEEHLASLALAAGGRLLGPAGTPLAQRAASQPPLDGVLSAAIASVTGIPVSQVPARPWPGLLLPLTRMSPAHHMCLSKQASSGHGPG